MTPDKFIHPNSDEAIDEMVIEIARFREALKEIIDLVESGKAVKGYNRTLIATIARVALDEATPCYPQNPHKEA